VSAVEFDKKTINSYNLIHNTNFQPIDITTLDEKILPDCDMICYSPPCQAFSNVGRQLGFNDKRGILFFDALRIIKEKMPKYCIMENVKGLTQKKFQNEFKEILNGLTEAGYVNYKQILNAKNHGIPQNRERIFIISVRKDINNNSFKFPEEFDNGIRLRDLLEEEVDEKYYICQDKTEKLIEQLKEKEFSNTIRSGGRGSLDRHQWDLVCVNNKIRKLTPLECIRLMGFDDQDYYILKENGISNSQIYKMAGNSIVVNVLEEIFKVLFSNT